MKKMLSILQKSAQDMQRLSSIDLNVDCQRSYSALCTALYGQMTAAQMDAKNIHRLNYLTVYDNLKKKQKDTPNIEFVL